MNISPVHMYNTKSISFGKLIAEKGVDTSTLNKLVSNENFKRLTDSTDECGYDTVVSPIKGKKGHTIGVREAGDIENKSYMHLANGTPSLLNAGVALTKWNGIREYRYLDQEISDDERNAKIVAKYNRTNGYE